MIKTYAGASAAGFVYNTLLDSQIINSHSKIDIDVLAGEDESLEIAGFVNSLGLESNIKDCSSVGNIKNAQRAAGFVASVGGNALISYSSSSVNVNANRKAAGFVIYMNSSGQQIPAKITQSYASGSIQSQKMGAGFASEVSTGSIIESSYSTGPVTCKAECSGFVNILGYENYPNESATIKNSYSTSDVSSDSTTYSWGYFGSVGFANIMHEGTLIENVYYRGVLYNENDNAAGLVGYHEAGSVLKNSFSAVESIIGSTFGFESINYTVTRSFDESGLINNYYLANGTCLNDNMDCSNSGEHLGVPVNNLSYFYNPNNQPLNQWDFNNNPWSINNGLPFLDL